MKILRKSIFLILLINLNIRSQNYNDASLSLEQAFIQLKKLKISTNLLKDSLNNGQISLHSAKFGFDEVKINNVNNESIEMVINGPNFIFDHFNFRTNYRLPNFYNLLLSEVSNRRYETPLDAFEILEKAIQTYFQKFSKYPKDYNDLVIESIIRPNKYPFSNNEWRYNISLPFNIVAETTSMHKRKGKSISLDWKTKTIANKESDDIDKESIKWSFDFKINKIEQSILSNTNVTLFPENFIIEFYQKYGKLSLNGLSITSAPNNNVFEQTIFKINDLNISASDLFFQIDNKEGYPNIQNGSGHFLIKNLEFKIPPSLTEDETINFLFVKLGVRNGLIRIRKADINFRFYDNEFGMAEASFISAFLKLNISGQFSIDQRKNGLSSFDLFDTEIRINPISFGTRDIIREWELKNSKSLYREGPVIIIKLSGPLSNPNIIGIN